MRFAGGLERIFHYHLKKCGGTSVNNWLANQVSDRREWNPRWLQVFGAMILNEQSPPKQFERSQREFAAEARSSFFHADAICSHVPIRAYAPANTFCFTILREPVERIVSQIADWRRLDLDQYPQLPAHVSSAMREAKSLPLTTFLERHGRSTFPYLLDNHLTRALAASRVGLAIVKQLDSGCLMDAALLALACDFDVVGITSKLDETCAAVAGALGVLSDHEMPRLNVTGSNGASADEAKAAAGALSELTRYDRLVYARACEIFDRRTVELAGRGSEAEFDDRHAVEAVRRLTPRKQEADTVFSVSDPIIGSGFHGRDSAGAKDCRLWTGPSRRSVLYMPAPPGIELQVKIWIHGYAAERQRGQLRLEIDDKHRPHRFEAADNVREIIVADTTTWRSFIKLTIMLDETLTSETAGASGGDERARGVSFDTYGWRVAP